MEFLIGIHGQEIRGQAAVVLEMASKGPRVTLQSLTEMWQRSVPATSGSFLDTGAASRGRKETLPQSPWSLCDSAVQD